MLLWLDLRTTRPLLLWLPPRTIRPLLLWLDLRTTRQLLLWLALPPRTTRTLLHPTPPTHRMPSGRTKAQAPGCHWTRLRAADSVDIFFAGGTVRLSKLVPG